MSTDSGSGLEGLIKAAQAGDKDALGQLLHQHRSWLRMFGSRQLRPNVRSRLDDSDLVQQTLLSALQGFALFKGSKAVEFQAWLKRIFERNLSDTIRFHATAERRNVDLEQPHNAMVDLSNRAGDLLSPSEAMLMGEAAVHLAVALDALSEDQQTAVRLRYIEGKSLAEISTYFDRSTVACAGLIKRGVQALRERLTRQ